MRSASTPRRSAKWRMNSSGFDLSRASQLNICCVASNAGSPTNGFGSITSQGSRRARRTFPACRSVASSTSFGDVRSSSLNSSRPSWTSPGSVQRSAEANVSSLQYAVSADSVRNLCPDPGGRHNRLSSRAIIGSCSASDRLRNVGPRLAALKEHGTQTIVSFKEPYGWIAIPETQTGDLILTLHVRHTKFQYRGRSIGKRRRCHPRAAPILSIERTADSKRPSLLQISDYARQLG